jgi:hypothetical protein
MMRKPSVRLGIAGFIEMKGMNAQGFMEDESGWNQESIVDDDGF